MKYDLEERTLKFADNVRKLLKSIPQNIQNTEDTKQLVRASGSVGANYLEANGALGNRDFLRRIRIARKEAKESRFFLRLIDRGENAVSENQRQGLVQEAKEPSLILGAILKKRE